MSCVHGLARVPALSHCWPLRFSRKSLSIYEVIKLLQLSPPSDKSLISDLNHMFNGADPHSGINLCLYEEISRERMLNNEVHCLSPKNFQPSYKNIMYAGKFGRF